MADAIMFLKSLSSGVLDLLSLNQIPPLKSYFSKWEFFSRKLLKPSCNGFLVHPHDNTSESTDAAVNSQVKWTPSPNLDGI